LSLKVNKSTHENKISDILNSFQLKLHPQEQSIQKFTEKLESLEETLHTLTPRIPENIEETINTLSTKTQEITSKLETKVEKDFMLHVINNLKPPKPQIIQNSPDFNDFWKFREQTIKNFEKSDEKFDKIMKALDLGIFKRVLASKANETSTRDEFLSVGQRLLNLERNQGEIFKELQNLTSQIRRLFSMLEEMGTTGSTFALISKKSLTGNCLSCGKGENSIVPTIPHIQGFDGRFYKADMNSFRPGHSSSDWKPEDGDSRSKSPINRLPRAGLNSILGKDLVTSLSSTSINRPSSAKK
jgi:predicted transcriptional regulator